MTRVANIVGFMHHFAPLELAEDWDNVGLLVGDSAAAVERIMTCLTVTPASVAEAIAEKAALIVSHHPVLFHPTQRLTAEQPHSRMLIDLIRAGVAVYSPHTAFDNTKGGINDILAGRLGLQDVMPLRPNQRAGKCKIVVFVPEADLANVSDALFQAGAGVIGEYSQCSFRLAGTGTFCGSEITSPTIGKKGKHEEVSEWRLEVLCPERGVSAAIQAMQAAHSYEEPAFDVYPLQSHLKTGVGRIGILPKAESLKAFAGRVTKGLQQSLVQVIGSAGRRVRRIAIACGAGGELLTDAIQAGADVFLTGEMRFHDQLNAQAQEMALVLPGHYATERPGIEELAKILDKQFPGMRVWPSRHEVEPTWCV